jgi:hypothetical protein
MHDLADIEQNINRILESQDRGIRELEHTLDNLKRLLAPLGDLPRSRALDYLFGLLVQRIRQKSATDPNSIDKQRRSINTLFRIQFEFGRVDIVLCKILGFLDVDSADVVNNWMNCVSSEVASAVSRYSYDLRQETLDTLRAHAAMYSHAGTDLARAMPALSPFVLQLNRAIESAEFARFERQLHAASARGRISEEVSDQLTEVGLSPSVLAAMEEAAEYLRSEGPFNPKKAADLMRTSIDESHREIVARLAVATGTPYRDANKDGSRRAFLRRVSFISEPEERFFSAIYSLLSEEASHKLIAPRETMLLMEQTVKGYLSLLIRRLSSFVPPQAAP